MLIGSNSNRMVLCNCEPQLPPKIKESERMLMIQRWVNNLPMPYIVEFIRNQQPPASNQSHNQNGSKLNSKSKEDYQRNSQCRCGALNPLPPPQGDDPEMVPPPGRIFSARAPFTTEDHIIFSSSGSAHQVQQTILSQHSNLQKYYCTHSPTGASSAQTNSSSCSSDNHYHSHSQRGQQHQSSVTSSSDKHQFPNASSTPNKNQPIVPSSSSAHAANNGSSRNSHPLNGLQHPDHQQHPQNHHRKANNTTDYSARSSPSPPSRKYQKLSMNTKRPYKDNSTNEPSTSQQNPSKCMNDSQNKDSRHFTQLETKLVVELFEDYFFSGELPSLAEVRNRIASTLLMQTRSAVSVRSKIKRLNSSGTWTQYKKS